MKTLLLMAMLMPTLILANKITPQPPPDPPKTEVPATAAATAASTSSSSANSTASASQAVDARTNSTSSGTGGASSLNQTIKSERTAPGVYTTGTNNNVPCHGEWHAGASVVVGGLSFGKDRKDKDCLLKSAADDQYVRGHYVAAARLYCKIGYYSDALGQDCIAMLSEPPPEAQPVDFDTTGLATKKDVSDAKSELHEEIGKAFKTSVSK